MPLVLPERLTDNAGFIERLDDNHANWLSEASASRQDIRAARIGILNLMPDVAMPTTEIQWLRFISHTDLQIEPTFLKFDDDPREGIDERGDPRSRTETLQTYTPFSEVQDQPFDALIVTGDNLEIKKPRTDPPEALPFDEVRYKQQIDTVFAWAQENVYSTFASCFGAHLLINHLTGIERKIYDKKIFGVYDHEVDTNSRSELLHNMDDVFPAPHSRFGDVSVLDLHGTTIEVLATHPKVGWLLAQHFNKAGGVDVLLQGHPEYDRDDLRTEYERDVGLGYNQAMPEGYYRNSDDRGKITMRWANAARALHANWISMIYNGVIANGSKS